MQVDSSPPFTSIAQAMGQTAQPQPAASDNDNDADNASQPAQPSTPSGVGGTLDLTV